jgi:hypothetical protein
VQSNKLGRHNPKDIAAEWYSKCQSDEDREELKQYLLASNRLFTLLKEMIQRRYDGEWGAKVADYDSPSWSHKQAHKNGRLDAYEEIFKLLP